MFGQHRDSATSRDGSYSNSVTATDGSGGNAGSQPGGLPLGDTSN